MSHARGEKREGEKVGSARVLLPLLLYFCLHCERSHIVCLGLRELRRCLGGVALPCGAPSYPGFQRGEGLGMRLPSPGGALCSLILHATHVGVHAGIRVHTWWSGVFPPVQCLVVHFG